MSSADEPDSAAVGAAGGVGADRCRLAGENHRCYTVHRRPLNLTSRPSGALAAPVSVSCMTASREARVKHAIQHGKWMLSGIETWRQPCHLPFGVCHLTQVANSLLRVDARFQPFRQSLFSEATLEFDRSSQPPAAVAKLDASIVAFLRPLQDHFLLPGAFQALEYLVRRFRCANRVTRLRSVHAAHACPCCGIDTHA